MRLRCATSYSFRHVDPIFSNRGRAEPYALRVRVDIIGHLKSCMTDIYLDIDARTADYIQTHPYGWLRAQLSRAGGGGGGADGPVYEETICDVRMICTVSI